MCTCMQLWTAHLPHDADLEAEPDEAAHVHVEAVHGQGGRHEVAVRKAVDVEVLGCQLGILPEEPELVAHLHNRRFLCQCQRDLW